MISSEDNRKIMQRACSHAGLVDGALRRVSMEKVGITLRHTDTTGDSVVITTEKLSCDFTNAAALEAYNRVVVPGLIDMLVEAEKRGNTAIRQLFSAQALYALRVVGDVTTFTHAEITRILAPRPAEDSSGLGQVLSFPACRR